MDVSTFWIVALSGTLFGLAGLHVLDRGRAEHT